ncbi:MAG: hypothetical protein ACREPT_10150, partial [Rudaea sp.]
MLIVVSVFGVAQSAQAAIPASERAVLINLYNSANGANWIFSSGWNGAPGTECSWYGVGCDAAQTTVNRITLVGDGLSGSLPSLSALPNLQVFNVNSSDLHGSIPTLTGLTNLQDFDVGQNYHLTGAI